jgi:hypothetical protein
MSADAPEFLLFKLESIDFRHDLYDETQTKLAILLNYEVIDRSWDYLLLNKLPKPLQKQVLKTTNNEYRLNEYITVDTSQALQYAKINIEYSLLGKLRRLLFQPPTLMATIQFEDGSKKTARAIKTIVNGGIFLNKYVSRTNRSTDAFLTYNGKQNKNIVKINFHTPHPWGFNSIFTISNQFIRIENYSKQQPEPETEINLIASHVTVPAINNNLQMSLDIFDEYDKYLEMAGWAYIKGSNSDNSHIYTVLKGNDTSIVLHTQRILRKDLSRSMNIQLDSSGFQTIIYKKKLPVDNYQIGVLVAQGDTQALKFTGKSINLKEFESMATDVKLSQPGNDLTISVDEFQESADYVRIKGWAHIKGSDSVNSRTYIVLQSDTNHYIFTTTLENRADVSAALGLNLDASGFISKISKINLYPGIYKIGLLISKGQNQESYQFTGKEIKIDE